MKVKSKDLMIGNIVFNPVTNKNVIVDGSLIAIEQMREKADENHEGFEAIELTENILEKLNFVTSSDPEVVTYTNKKTGFKLFRKFARSVFYIELENNSAYISTVQLKYVHELQNIHYLITKNDTNKKTS